MIVDADPQCNLTGSVVGVDESEVFYEKGIGKTSNIYSLLEPCIIKGRGHIIPDVALHQTANNNLLLLAGSQDLSEIDVQLSVALKTSASLKNMNSFLGFVSHAIREVARKNSIDIVILDMSPSIGALNECLLMGSDYFIVPTSPDFYCYQAIISLSKKIPEWDNEMLTFRNNTIDVQVRSQKPQFIGIISQRYRLRKDAAIQGRDTTKAFQEWIDKINDKVNDKLIPSLRKNGMSVTEEQFKQCFPNEKPFNIVDIPEFNTLIARSHEYSLPIFELGQNELLTGGYALHTQLDSVSKFKKIFDDFANGVIAIVS